MYFLNPPGGEIGRLIKQYMKKNPPKYIVFDPAGLEWIEIEPPYDEDVLEKLKRQTEERAEFLKRLDKAREEKEFSKKLRYLKPDIQYIVDKELFYDVLLQLQKGTVYRVEGKDMVPVKTDWEKLAGIIKYAKFRTGMDEYVIKERALSFNLIP